MPDDQRSDAERLIGDLVARRHAKLQDIECPMCKARNWSLHDRVYAIPHMEHFYTEKHVQYWESQTDDSNRVLRADCMACGFVVLFCL